MFTIENVSVVVLLLHDGLLDLCFVLLLSVVCLLFLNLCCYVFVVYCCVCIFDTMFGVFVFSSVKLSMRVI
jgi:hypothetical protein